MGSMWLMEMVGMARRAPSSTACAKQGYNSLTKVKFAPCLRHDQRSRYGFEAADVADGRRRRRSSRLLGAAIAAERRVNLGATAPTKFCDGSHGQTQARCFILCRLAGAIQTKFLRRGDRPLRV